MNQSEVRQIALSLPEVTEEPHFQRVSFRVRGRIIATAIPNEPFLNVMIGEPAREPVLVMHSDVVEKLFWGNRVMGLRVDLRQADAGLVADLLAQAWREKAPKTLVGTAAEVEIEVR
jgi:hypothetical protein